MSPASPKGSYQVTRPHEIDGGRGAGSAADSGAGGPGRRPPEHTSRLDIDWVRTIAGALAAVSSAVLLSTLGAAGTLVGAALGSVVVTVGGALYSQGLTHSRVRLARASIPARPGATSSTHDEMRQDETRRIPAAAVDEPARRNQWHERLAVLPWRRVGLYAAAMFVATILVITAFEIVAGRSLSSMVGGHDGGGGTTITHLDGSDRDTPREEDQAPEDDEATPTGPPPSESPEATEVPAESPSVLTTTSPTPDPTTPTPDPTTTMPPPTDASAPTSTPTLEPTATP